MKTRTRVDRAALPVLTEHRRVYALDTIGDLRRSELADPVLLGPMGLPAWRATVVIVGPLTSLALRPTDAKRDALIRRGLGHGERVNRELLEWMRVAGRCRPRVGKPLPLPDRMLGRIQAPTSGPASRDSSRTSRTRWRCSPETPPRTDPDPRPS